MKSCSICGMPIKTKCARKACVKIRTLRPWDQEKNPPKVRCACFIPGGIQCKKAMYHDGEHLYEPVVPFSEYVPK